MTFPCPDVEAHKDACYVVQLGINNNLSGEHAPKVGRGASSAAPSEATALLERSSGLVCSAVACTGCGQLHQAFLQPPALLASAHPS